MIWTDIQQSMYTTPSFFNNIATGSENNHNNSLTVQPSTNLKHQSPIGSPSYSNSARTNSISSSTEDDEYNNSASVSHRTNLKRKFSSKLDNNNNNESEDNTDEKRKNFLERNRQAALKCRQRKKQWLNNLQERVEYLANDNEQLQLQANAMKEEVLNLRSLLMMHKDCHINTGNTILVPQNQQLPHLPIQQLSQRQGNHNIGSTTTTKMI